MKNKLKEMYVKCMELMVCENMVYVNCRMNIVMYKMDENNLFLWFEEIEDYICDLEICMNEEYECDMFDMKIVKFECEMKEKNDVLLMKELIK